MRCGEFVNKETVLWKWEFSAEQRNKGEEEVEKCDELFRNIRLRQIVYLLLHPSKSIKFGPTFCQSIIFIFEIFPYHCQAGDKFSSVENANCVKSWQKPRESASTGPHRLNRFRPLRNRGFPRNALHCFYNNNFIQILDKKSFYYLRQMQNFH